MVGRGATIPSLKKKTLLSRNLRVAEVQPRDVEPMEEDCVSMTPHKIFDDIKSQQFEGVKILSSLLCNFLDSPILSSFYVSDALPNALSANILNVLSSEREYFNETILSGLLICL